MGVYVRLFDFLMFFLILRQLLASRRSREFLLLNLFLYEKVVLWTSILEAPLALCRDIQEAKASREATALDRQRKIPTCDGDFSKEFLLVVLWRREYYIIFSEKSNFFIPSWSSPRKTPPSPLKGVCVLLSGVLRCTRSSQISLYHSSTMACRKVRCR